MSNSTNPDMTAARAHLNDLGIPTNDASNGIFLPSTNAVASQVAADTGEILPGHKSIHTKDYISDVASRVLGSDTKDAALEQLAAIKENILNGLYGKAR